jgi:hypothetical protein
LNSRRGVWGGGQNRVDHPEEVGEEVAQGKGEKNLDMPAKEK